MNSHQREEILKELRYYLISGGVEDFRAANELYAKILTMHDDQLIDEADGLFEQLLP